MTDYRVDVLSSAGQLQASFAQFAGLSYSKHVNQVGVLRLAVDAASPAAAYLVDKAIVEVWRRDLAAGIAWHRDFDGLVRTRRYRYPESEPETLDVWVSSALTMLSWRVVAWRAETANRSAFSNVAGETIMKTLVNYNAAGAATVANGRLREGAIAGISVEADGGRGNAVTRNCAYAGLLEQLQEVAQLAGGDFDLVKTGPAAWQFRYYPGQRGTDRRGELTFGLEWGNMASPAYTESHAGERTVALVGGQGEGAARAVALRTGADYVAGSNDFEVYVDARNEETAAGLNAKGDAALAEGRARGELSFALVETPACLYNREFFLGDLVTATYRDIAATVKVVGVTVSLSEDGEGEEKKFVLEAV